MKTLNILIILIVTLFIVNCENQRFVEAGVVWADDSYFTTEGDWYLALSEGCYSNCEGASVEVVDQLPLAVGEDVIKRFALGSGSGGNLTAFVYLDINGSGMYEDGIDIMTGYKFNYSDASETTWIAVSAFY